jgi:V8-like Glu-specific endopeptidase
MASNMWACGGDSGSPVYDGSKAIGVISQGSKGSTGTVECGQQGANSFYSHIYWVQDELNVALRIS